MAIYKDRGIVLSGFRLGEADRIVSLLTEGRGLVRAVAKGIRRTKSRFGGRLEPISHIDLVLYEGRNLDTVTGVETIDSFRNIREDLDRFVIASSMAESVTRIAQEHEPAPLMYKLLLAGLRELDANRPGPVVLTGYLMRFMEVAGFGMTVGDCLECGAPGPHTRIGIDQGGTLCDKCGADAVRVEPGTVALLADLATARIARANALDVPPPNSAEAGSLILRFVEYHLDRHLRSVAIGAIAPRGGRLVQT